MTVAGTETHTSTSASQTGATTTTTTLLPLPPPLDCLSVCSPRATSAERSTDGTGCLCVCLAGYNATTNCSTCSKGYVPLVAVNGDGHAGIKRLEILTCVVPSTTSSSPSHTLTISESVAPPNGSGGPRQCNLSATLSVIVAQPEIEDGGGNRVGLEQPQTPTATASAGVQWSDLFRGPTEPNNGAARSAPTAPISNDGDFTSRWDPQGSCNVTIVSATPLGDLDFRTGVVTEALLVWTDDDEEAASLSPPMTSSGLSNNRSASSVASPPSSLFNPNTPIPDAALIADVTSSTVWVAADDAANTTAFALRGSGNWNTMVVVVGRVSVSRVASAPIQIASYFAAQRTRIDNSSSTSTSETPLLSTFPRLSNPPLMLLLKMRWWVHRGSSLRSGLCSLAVVPNAAPPSRGGGSQLTASPYADFEFRLPVVFTPPVLIPAAAQAATQVAVAVASLAAGQEAMRALAVLSLASRCRQLRSSEETSSSNVPRPAFPETQVPGLEVGSDAARGLRGAVVGNVIFVSACSLLGLVVVFARHVAFVTSSSCRQGSTQGGGRGGDLNRVVVTLLDSPLKGSPTPTSWRLLDSAAACQLPSRLNLPFAIALEGAVANAALAAVFTGFVVWHDVLLLVCVLVITAVVAATSYRITETVPLYYDPDAKTVAEEQQDAAAKLREGHDATRPRSSTVCRRVGRSVRWLVCGVGGWVVAPWAAGGASPEDIRYDGLYGCFFQKLRWSRWQPPPSHPSTTQTVLTSIPPAEIHLGGSLGHDDETEMAKNKSDAVGPLRRLGREAAPRPSPVHHAASSPSVVVAFLGRHFFVIDVVTTVTLALCRGLDVARYRRSFTVVDPFAANSTSTSDVPFAANGSTPEVTTTTTTTTAVFERQLCRSTAIAACFILTMFMLVCIVTRPMIVPLRNATLIVASMLNAVAMWLLLSVELSAASTTASGGGGEESFTDLWLLRLASWAAVASGLVSSSNTILLMGRIVVRVAEGQFWHRRRRAPSQHVLEDTTTPRILPAALPICSPRHGGAAADQNGELTVGCGDTAMMLPMMSASCAAAANRTTTRRSSQKSAAPMLVLVAEKAPKPRRSTDAESVVSAPAIDEAPRGEYFHSSDEGIPPRPIRGRPIVPGSQAWRAHRLQLALQGLAMMEPGEAEESNISAAKHGVAPGFRRDDDPLDDLLASLSVPSAAVVPPRRRSPPQNPFGENTTRGGGATGAAHHASAPDAADSTGNSDLESFLDEMLLTSQSDSASQFGSRERAAPNGHY